MMLSAREAECRDDLINAMLLSLGENPLIKGNWGSFIGGMRPLIGGRSATPFFDALWRRSPIFKLLYRLKWRFLCAQSPQLNSTESLLERRGTLLSGSHRVSIVFDDVYHREPE